MSHIEAMGRGAKGKGKEGEHTLVAIEKEEDKRQEGRGGRRPRRTQGEMRGNQIERGSSKAEKQEKLAQS